ncbi:MAG TPA: GNAT family N-acetyltransferase [Blastocatellia bacterium]|nr:GNAT family N-acetyltransferase [Blastocatellia bacterium]
MISIDQMDAADWPAVSQIYLDGIATGDATFETGVPSWEEWNDRHLPFARLVARLKGDLVGWAALSPVSTRKVYSGVAEVSVYVSPQHQRHGVGLGLLVALIDASEKNGIWTLQAGIFPENTGSLRLHEACDFRVVGVRERIGRTDDRWRDVVLLERRSKITGTE